MSSEETVIKTIAEDIINSITDEVIKKNAKLETIDEGEETASVEEETQAVEEETQTVEEETQAVEEETQAVEEETQAVEEETQTVEEETQTVEEDEESAEEELSRVKSEMCILKENLLNTLTQLEVYKTNESRLQKANVKKHTGLPDIIIIVPYRDRVSQRSAFLKIMPEILKGKNYEIYFAHQRDNRPFNRGAVKNLGFLHVKRKYGLDCKNITIVFHDIDVMPWHPNQFSYQTRHNVVNHFYGFEHALGGILAMKAADFDKINGFPNIWTWGLEDNVLQMRCAKNGIGISRNEFVSISKDNKNIISLWHGWDRLISPNIEPKWRHDNGTDGIRSIRNISMHETPINNDNIMEINITSFETGEPLSSPFVRNARMRNARHHQRQNEPIYNNTVQRRGAYNAFQSFGRKTRARSTRIKGMLM